MQVKANDPHLDAKAFPSVHPWGTGSLLAEPGSGSAARYARNRATNIESFFRRNGLSLTRAGCRHGALCLLCCLANRKRTAIWCFWKLDYHIKNALFFSHKRSARSGHKQAPTNDPVTALFGTAVPSSIPESGSWWLVPPHTLQFGHIGRPLEPNKSTGPPEEPGGDQFRR